MIINPYDFKVQKEEKVAKEEKLDVKVLIKEISEYILNNFQAYIENGKKDAVKSEIKKELECKYKINSSKGQACIIQDVMDRLFGYGILQKYIDDTDVSDIRVVKSDAIYVKKKGVWQKVKDTFGSEEELNEYIRFCTMKNNAVINNEAPICIFSDRKNALRLEAGIMPANVDSSSLVIRIHRKDNNMSLEELMLKEDMLNVEMYKYISREIKSFKSFVICGKGGSGKTTLLKAIINMLPEEVAITTSEETAELFINSRNVISRECILDRNESKQVDLERLARHSLVMSNDVLVLGELKRSRGKYIF